MTLAVNRPKVCGTRSHVDSQEKLPIFQGSWQQGVVCLSSPTREVSFALVSSAAAWVTWVLARAGDACSGQSRHKLPKSSKNKVRQHGYKDILRRRDFCRQPVKGFTVTVTVGSRVVRMGGS